MTLPIQLKTATRGLLYTLIFLIPLFFLPFTLDVLEINKQTLLLVLTFAAALTWIGSMLFAKKFHFQRGWINIFPVLFLVTLALSAKHSASPYISWVGTSMQEYSSFLTMFGLVVLFYLLTNTLRDNKTHKTVHFLLISSANLTGLIGLLSLFDIHIFSYAFAQTKSFNTVGTLNSLGIYLAVMAVFAAGIWVSHRKDDNLFLYKGVYGSIASGLIITLQIITALYLTVLNYWVVWTVLLIGMGTLFIFGLFRAKDFSGWGRMTLPAIMIFIALPLLFWKGAPIKIDVPSEVTPSFESSRQISSQTIKESSSSYGSGPGTYAFNYARFRGQELNETDFWNTRFDRAASYYLTALPTYGYLTIITLGLFMLALAIRSVIQILKPSTREKWLQSFIAFAPWLTIVSAGFLYSYNLTLMFLLFTFSGLLASQVVKDDYNKTYKEAPGIALLISCVFVIGAIGFFVGIFVTSERYLAEMSFASAIRADRDGASIQLVVEDLDRAATLNRFDDRYFRTLSEALLLRVDQQMKNISGADQLTIESREYVQALVAASVNAGVRATNLSPNNSTNWLVRGRVYKELTSVLPNAAEFAVASHEQAVLLEPVNPAHWNELGKTYLISAEQHRQLTVADNEQVANQAKQNLELYLNKAEQAFLKATNLKPNYATAHFQLGITYERQGRLDDSISKLESVAKYNPLDVGVVFQLGQLYLRRNKPGDLSSAQARFEKVVELAPSYSNAHWYLASIYETNGKIQKAVVAVENVLKINPTNSLVKNRLTRLLRGDEPQNESNGLLKPLE